jgi:hypothetical protein
MPQITYYPIPAGGRLIRFPGKNREIALTAMEKVYISDEELLMLKEDSEFNLCVTHGLILIEQNSIADLDAGGETETGETGETGETETGETDETGETETGETEDSSPRTRRKRS